ncbi:signal peptide peptidase, partial [Helicosporidium sp. ATCC 50920]
RLGDLSNASAAGVVGEVGSQPLFLPNGSPLEVRIWQPPFPTWDFSPLLLWTLASFIVFVGASLASADALRSLRLSHRRGSAEAPAAPKPLAGEEASLGVSAALGFVVLASCVLLLLYFFRSRWLLLALSAVYALGCTYPLALFATRLFSLLCPALAATGAPGATRALSRLGLLPDSLKEDASGELVQPLAPEGHEDESRRSNGGLVDGLPPQSPLLAATLSYADLAGWTAAACICLTWLLFPYFPGAWALQNLMGGAFIALLLKDVVVPNLRVAAALLGAAAVYDVWWVFLQPRVTGGPSVMVDVAGGGGGEHFPGTLLAPQTSLGDSPAMAVLGFGDVALPGLLVALCARWDGARAFEQGGRSVAAISSQSCCRRLWDRCGCAPGLWGPRGYALWALCAYGVGLALTYGALFLGVGGQGGQPALLYLAPTTLAAVGGLAWARGEFWGLWSWGSGAQEDVGEV